MPSHRDVDADKNRWGTAIVAVADVAAVVGVSLLRLIINYDAIPFDNGLQR